MERGGVDQLETPVTDASRLRPRQELHQVGGHRNRTRARPSPTVGGSEGLVQIHVHDVKAHVARAHGAQDGVQVGAVVVQQSTDVVHRFGDLDNLLLKEAYRVRVRQHNARHVRSEGRL